MCLKKSLFSVFFVRKKRLCWTKFYSPPDSIRSSITDKNFYEPKHVAVAFVKYSMFIVLDWTKEM